MRRVTRVPLPDKLRFEILKRDKFTCVYCGRSAQKDGIIVHVDHVDPVALGGENDPSNLVTACEDCNLGKGAEPLDDSAIGRAITRPKLVPRRWRWTFLLGLAIALLQGWSGAVWIGAIVATVLVVRLARGGIASW